MILALLIFLSVCNTRSLDQFFFQEVRHHKVRKLMDSTFINKKFRWTQRAKKSPENEAF